MSDAIRDAVLLRVGGAIGVPPANTKALFADTDGTVKIIDSTGAKSSVGGAAGTMLTALARAQSLLGTTVDTVLGTDFDNDQWYASVGVGTGTVSQSTTDRAGCVILNTGATGSSQANIKPHGGNATTHVDNPQTARWFIQTRAKITTAVDAQAQISYQLSGNSGNPHARLGIIGSLSAAFFSWEVTTNGGSATNGVTSVAFDNNFHTFEIWGDTVNINFAIDGTVVGTTPVANIGTTQAFLYAETLNGGTAASRSHSIDRQFICMASN